MAKEPNILFDKTEIMMKYEDSGNINTANLTYNQITRIQFEKCTERKLFKKIDSEKIEVVTPKLAVPITFYKEKEKPYFDEYKVMFAKFAKENRITFIDNTNN